MDTVIAVKLLDTIGKTTDEATIRKLYQLIQAQPNEDTLKKVLSQISGASLTELENKGLQIMADTAIATASSQPAVTESKTAVVEDVKPAAVEEDDDDDFNPFDDF